MIVKKRAQAIVIEQGRILMVHHNDHAVGERYWCLPGGGIEAGEHPAAAAVRELREETGLDVEIVADLGEQRFPGVTHGYAASHTFAARVVGGSLALGHDPEHADWAVKYLQDVGWLPIEGELLARLERYFFRRADARFFGREVHYL